MGTMAFEFPENTRPFMDAIRSIVDMHLQKGKDYGSDENPYHNIEACEDMGIPAWIGVTMRMNDKEVRIKNFLKRGSLTNESVRDSIHDNAVYGILRLMEYDRVNQTPKAVADGPFKCTHKYVSDKLDGEFVNICTECGRVTQNPVYSQFHSWDNTATCTRCGLIHQAYGHAWGREAINVGVTCKPRVGEPAQALRYNSKAEVPSD